MSFDNIDEHRGAMVKAYANAEYQKGYEQGKKDAVKHGYWFGVHECPQCSECLEYVTEDGMWDEDYALYKYCPNCGARMDGDK